MRPNNQASRETRIVSLSEIREKVSQTKRMDHLSLQVNIEADKGTTLGELTDAVGSLQQRIDMAISAWKVANPEMVRYINVTSTERKL